MSLWARLGGLALGATAAQVAYRALTRHPPYEKKLWLRGNHRGDRVTLLEGPAFVLATAGGTALAPGLSPRLRLAALVATLGAGGCGMYDDLADSGSSRGFAGHLSALASGEVTSGAVKMLGIGVAGLVAGALVAESTPDALINGAVIAGSANLVNLLDLRPGRAIKAGLLMGGPPLAAGGAGAAVVAVPLGAAAALLPDDLAERSMLGDAGANALGALLGLAAVIGLGRGSRLTLLGALAALTTASEKVSFTRVIEAAPALRWFDQLGRRPR